MRVGRVLSFLSALLVLALPPVAAAVDHHEAARGGGGHAASGGSSIGRGARGSQRRRATPRATAGESQVSLLGSPHGPQAPQGSDTAARALVADASHAAANDVGHHGASDPHAWRTQRRRLERGARAKQSKNARIRGRHHANAARDLWPGARTPRESWIEDLSDEKLRLAIAPGGRIQRRVHDLRGKRSDRGLAGAKLVLREGGGPTGDRAVDEAYIGAGLTHAFLREVLGQDSVDGHGMPLDLVIHADGPLDNAHWDSKLVAFGDGDGRTSGRNTKTLSIVAHELGHAVTEFGSNLVYEGQAGALNESFSDVLGVMVEQWAQDQSVHEADFLVERGTNPAVPHQGLRSLSDPQRGALVRQPAHMYQFVHTRRDNGGVHANSGIPNHAFYLTATRLGGRSWERAGKIWLLAQRNLPPHADFVDAARMMHEIAGSLYGYGSVEQQAVRAGWEGVGVFVPGHPPARGESAAAASAR